MPDETLLDPLGRSIVLHDHTWFRHILAAHPEMAGFRGFVTAAVEYPWEVRRSHSDPSCRLYFGPGPRRGTITKVVADVDLGLVKTAHFARIISGGDLEWP